MNKECKNGKHLFPKGTVISVFPKGILCEQCKKPICGLPTSKGDSCMRTQGHDGYHQNNHFDINLE